MGIRDDRVWRAADSVTTQRCCRVRLIHVYRHRDERGIDRSRHLFIGPDFAFHDPTGNAPLAGEEEDDRLAGLGSLLLGRRVVVGPSDVVERDVVAIPAGADGDDGDDGDDEEGKPEISPELKDSAAMRL